MYSNYQNEKTQRKKALPQSVFEHEFFELPVGIAAIEVGFPFPSMYHAFSQFVSVQSTIKEVEESGTGS
jgi:hypothetical protein